ncbi:M12 family metallopeptidase [Sorangium sp. So ce1000]|uniref:M12 family metallopeptidase n=1 Tax=Sorangium sp. So ce1000 TaxID=3133325 RepID=UPI003F5E4644
MRSIGSFVLALAGGVLGAGCGAESAAELGAPETGRCGPESTEPECAASIAAELGMGRQGEWRSLIMNGKNGPEEVHYQEVNGLAVSQGDIILGNAEELESKGVGIKSRSLRWPNRHVPYLFDDNLPEETRNHVNSAIAHWEENTNFDFEYVASPAPGTNYIRFKDSDMCASHVGMQGGAQLIYTSKGRSNNEIVGIANFRAPALDVVLTYFADGLMFAGSSTDLDQGGFSVPYSLPPGYSPVDIVGMSMATSLSHIYTWYSDGKYSIGTLYDLDSVQGPTSYTVAPGENILRIRGIGFADTSDPDDREVLVWYSDGKVSIGSPSDFGAISGTTQFFLPSGVSASNVVEMDTDTNNIVHLWYSDGTLYSGTFIYPYAFGTESYSMAPGCFRGSLIHEIGHAVGLYHEHSRCDRDNYVTVHEENVIDDDDYAFIFDKLCLERDLYSFDFNSVMLYGSFAYSVDPGDPTKATMVRADNNATFEVQRNGLSAGDLRSIKELYGYSPPANKQPTNIVATAISSTGRVYTWYSNGTRTGGTADDLDSAVASAAFSLPPGKTVGQIVAMSIDPSDHVVTWYSDSTVSVGNSTDLDFYASPSAYTLPPGKTPADIVEIGMDPSGKVYAWYDDETASKGTVADLDAYVSPYLYYLPPGKTPAMVAGIDVASNTPTVYVWYTDFTFSSGNSVDLDSIQEAW